VMVHLYEKELHSNYKIKQTKGYIVYPRK